MKRLFAVAAVLAVIAQTGGAFAADAAQIRKIKKTVNNATLPEVPATIAQLVRQASPSERQIVALTAVEAGVYRSPASASVIVAHLAKSAPDVTDAVAKKVIELSSTSIAADRASGRPAVANGNGNGNANGRSGNSGQGRGNGGRGGNATGHFEPGEHNPGPPLPNSPPHHNRPPHPLGGPPGLVDYSKPRPHH